MSGFALPQPLPSQPLTGRRVLVVILGFFGLVMAMNGVFVWLALSSFSGVTSDTAYVDGLSYNETLAAAEAQKERGWTGVVSLAEGAVTLQLTDAQGKAVQGLRLEATIGRPATRIFDQRLILTEAAPGLYVAAAALAEGLWQVTVLGEDAEGHPFRTEARLWLR